MVGNWTLSVSSHMINPHSSPFHSSSLHAQMADLQDKCGLSNALERCRLAPAGYRVDIIDEEDFVDLMYIRLAAGSSLPVSIGQLVKTTLHAKAIALSCDDLIWKEIKHTFRSDDLSDHTRSLLTTIFQSGWAVVDLEWEDNILLLIEDRRAAEVCQYWTFFDDPRAIYLGTTEANPKK